MNPLILILLVIGASAFMSATSFKEAVSFRLNRIKPDYIKSLATGLNTIYIDTNFDMINPTDFFISIENIEMNASYKNIEIAKFGVTNTFKINPNAVTKINMPVQVNTKSLIGNAKDLIDNIFTTGVTLDITGVIRTSYGTIHYSEKRLVEI